MGQDEFCYFNSIQQAIDSVPSDNMDLEVRLSKEFRFQENLLITAQAIILKGSYNNCTDALNNISTDFFSYINSDSNKLPVISITNPQGFSNREIVIENIGIEDGNNTTASESAGGGIATYLAQADIYLNHVSIKKNQAQLGGGIFTQSPNTHIFINESFVRNNYLDSNSLREYL